MISKLPARISNSLKESGLVGWLKCRDHAAGLAIID